MNKFPLEVVRDEPGVVFEAASVGPDPTRLQRILLLVTLSPPLVGALILAAFLAVLAPWHVFLGFVPFLAAAFGFSAWMLHLVGRRFGYWNRILVDAREGRLALRWFPMVCLWHWRREWSFRAIRSLRFTLGRERSGASLPLWLEVVTDAFGRSSSIHLPFLVRHLDRRAEGLDLAFRVARIVGFRSYRVLRSDPRWLEIELLEDRSGTPVPALRAAADYAADIAVEIFTEPEQQVQAFDPRVLPASMRDVDWRPGQRVCLKVPPISPGQIAVGSLVGAVVIALPGTWLLGGFVGRAAMVPLLGVLLVLGALLGGLIRRARWETSLVLLDWERDEAVFVHGAAQQRVALGDIQGLVLRGQSARRTTTTQDADGLRTRRIHHVYWCSLVALLPGGEALVYRSAVYHEDRESPYELTLPMTVDLARGLARPWRWGGYQPDSSAGGS